MIVTVNLNPTLDFICPVEKFVPGTVLRSKNISHYPGGKGANVARAVSVLGGKAVSAGLCGSLDLVETEVFLKKYGVKPVLIPVKGRNRTCLLISGKYNETIINSESTLEITAQQRAGFLKKIRSLSKSARVFVFAGSLPSSLPRSYYASCVRAVRDNSIVILDSSGKSLRNGIKAGPHIVKVNVSELESAFNVRFGAAAGTALRAVRNRLKKFIISLGKKYGIAAIIVTLGKKGSAVYYKNGITFIKPAKVKKPVSPVGCGDAYSAGLAYGIDKGMCLADSCRLGAAAAAANLAHEGACFFSKKEVMAYFKGL